MVDLFYKRKDSNFASYADDTTVVYYRATKKKSPRKKTYILRNKTL